MPITNQMKHLEPELEFKVNHHLYETSNSYRCRVDYVLKLLAGDELRQVNQVNCNAEDVINLEKDFILGYN
ncbi:hypothetical protein FM038_020525 [Shewanella eurypsychrophilus]|uniref:Uncharacterized protein n=1 Tax=Shewanella eurypsychrophilus TaxID=2593656 RepID=A0ABX6VBV3_9GAMM|nr:MULTISPECIES: hypothetical protein [Shewanella]QFU24298.1 hypothetical protein FS418_22240 [Shewanella sp. YLB-09]QPG59498.1 hypothetical protein FM038_020525 [Shewanella eurypsychrophilus]